MKRHSSPTGKSQNQAAAAQAKKHGRKNLRGSAVAGEGLIPFVRDWPPLRSCVLLTVVTLLCLVPFSVRDFHIDDPLFVWAAKQIVNHPSDPYGFKLVWYKMAEPMSAVTKNPPLASYYGAVVGYFAGWSERAFHLAFLLPALGIILGTYRLARRFCRTPLLAAAAALLTPGFLVSAGTVMCDTMMLAFWIFAIIFWIDGLEPIKPLYLSAAGLMIAAGALTKYFGMSLIPLLLVYTLVRQRRLGSWAWFFLIPVVVLAGYQMWTGAYYGRGLLLDAAQYASSFQGTENVSTLAKGLVCLGFIGGCMLPALTFAPVLWSRVVILIGAMLSGCAALVIGMDWANAGALVAPDHGGLVGLQLALFLAGGGCVLALAAADIWKWRDANSLLLILWVLGTLLFAGFFNWTVNIRSVLPLVPAASIILVRRLEAVGASPGYLCARLGVPLLVSGLLSLWVAWADADLANSARRAATLIQERAQSRPGAVWFQGHWGFQYYMEAFGARPLDTSKKELRPGDLLVIPENNNNTFAIPAEVVASQETIEVAMHQGLATMNRNLGAGFYFYRWGPIPFVFGSVPPERYHLLRLAPLPGRK